MNQKPFILICDDDSEMLRSLSLSLRFNYEVVTANSVSRAKEFAGKYDFDAAVVDLNFEGQEYDGVHLIDFLSKQTPATFLIVLSGDSSTKRVVEAMRRNLFEFVVKDENYFERLVKSLKESTQMRMVKKASAVEKYLTQSKAVKEVLEKVELIIRSKTKASILIRGESGTGKEFLAQHVALNLNQRAITANMGCIPKDMAESILFGHERGAFTGAITSKTGLIETAHNNIFFLDEVGECPPSVQTKLLRVLQEGEIQPLGSNKTKNVDVRFIAATHRNLEELVEEGTFRFDLLQRLNTFVLRLPALRERPEDILFYANLFVNELAQDGQRFSITPEGELELLNYSWPGNIRELRNVIERIIVLSSKTLIDREVVCEAIQLGKSPSEVKVTPAQIVKSNARRDELIKALTESNGNKRLAAMSLGIGEATIYRWLKEFNLSTVLSSHSLKNKCEMIV